MPISRRPNRWRRYHALRDRGLQEIVPITVDNIDHAAGRIALILALAGNQHGHFGYQPNADDVAPEVSEQ